VPSVCESETSVTPLLRLESNEVKVPKIAENLTSLQEKGLGFVIASLL